jgi:flagellar capping protein FliD
MSFVEIKELSLEDLIKTCASLLHVIEDLSDDIDTCDKGIERYHEEIDRLRTRKANHITTRSAKQSFYDECFELLKKRMKKMQD